jgi:UDP-N-acetylglucosamine acyltransferase
LISPHAIIDSSAQLAEDVEVGPWTIIGPDVVIGAGCRIASHVVIKGPTRIGANNHIFQFSTIGEDTPDLKYAGEATRLEIGDDNVFREGVTIHRGTAQDNSVTIIGSNNLMMAYVHVGHDSIVGSHCVFANNAALAGHVKIGDYANISGYTLIHQFCSVGAYAFTGMGTAISMDVPAYVLVAGNPVAAKSVNVVGLKRRDFSREDINSISNAFKTLYRRGLTLDQALVELERQSQECTAINLMIDSLRSSNRGIVR